VIPKIVLIFFFLHDFRPFSGQNFGKIPIFPYYKAKMGQKSGKNYFFSEIFWESLNTIRIYVCVKFWANWSTLGAKMAIFQFSRY
jgi:hypothetical protein